MCCSLAFLSTHIVTYRLYSLQALDLGIQDGGDGSHGSIIVQIIAGQGLHRSDERG
jgi:hypothetical protein